MQLLFKKGGGNQPKVATLRKMYDLVGLEKLSVMKPMVVINAADEADTAGVWMSPSFVHPEIKFELGESIVWHNGARYHFICVVKGFSKRPTPGWEGGSTLPKELFDNDGSVNLDFLVLTEASAVVGALSCCIRLVWKPHTTWRSVGRHVFACRRPRAAIGASAWCFGCPTPSG